MFVCDIYDLDTFIWLSESSFHVDDNWQTLAYLIIFTDSIININLSIFTDSIINPSWTEHITDSSLDYGLRTKIWINQGTRQKKNVENSTLGFSTFFFWRVPLPCITKILIFLTYTSNEKHNNFCKMLSDIDTQ